MKQKLAIVLCISLHTVHTYVDDSQMSYMIWACDIDNTA